MLKKWLLGLIAVIVFIVGLTVGSFAAGPIQIFIDGINIKTDVEPQIYQERTLVPIRAVSETLGAKVSWDSSNKSVLINTSANIWDAPFDPWHDLSAYQAVYVVNEYLALLQGAVWGGDLSRYPFLFSQRVREAPEPWAEVWQPSMSGMPGTSVCRLNFRVLDGRVAGKDEKGNPVYEIAARVQSYDPRAGEPAFTDWVKVYRVITEVSTNENGSQSMHMVIDGERTIKTIKMKSTEMPDFWHSF